MTEKQAPPFKLSAKINLPVPEIIPLDRSLVAYQIPDVKQEITKIEIVFKAGKWFDPKPGVSHFTSQMLDKGTADLTSSAIAEFFDQYGAFIEINPGADFVSISLYSLNKNINKVFPTFLQIITESTFPKKELDQTKESFLQSLKINKQKSSYLASKAINQGVFGTDHPYGRSIEEDNVINLSVEDLISYHFHFMNPYKVFIVGKSTNEIIDRLKNAFPLTNSNYEFSPKRK
ncbi:MAG: insulinase family protein [Flammeovirgaceae bacterium]|nr:insulinase family protein [Flammeovirgaceae bacterium]